MTMKAAGETTSVLAVLGRAFPVLNIAVEAYITAATGATGATAILKGGLAALGAVIKAHPFLFLASALISVISVLSSYSDEQKELQQKNEEVAQSLRDKIKAFNDEMKSVDDLIDEYKKLKDSEFISSESRERILEIQEDIRDLIGLEISDWDALNGSVEENIRLLKQKKLEELNDPENTNQFKNAYKRTRGTSNTSKYIDTDELLYGTGWAYSAETQEVTNFVQNVFQPWKFWTEPDYEYLDPQIVVDNEFDNENGYKDEYEDVINDAVDKIQNISSYWDMGNNIVKFWGDTARENLEAADAALFELEELGAENSNYYAAIAKARDFYYKEDLKITEAAKGEFDYIFSKMTLEDEIDLPTIDTQEAFNTYFSSLLSEAMNEETIKDMVENGDLSNDYIQDTVETYLAEKFPDFFDEYKKEKIARDRLTLHDAKGYSSSLLMEQIDRFTGDTGESGFGRQKFQSVREIAVELLNTGYQYSSFEELLKKSEEVYSERILSVPDFSEQSTNIAKANEELKSLKNIYNDIQDGGEFDWDSIINNEDFKNAFSICGDVYDNFISVISSSPDDINACQGAFNDLIKEYLRVSPILTGVTEETKEMTAALLEMAGVAGATEIVERRVAYNEVVKKYSTGEYLTATYDELEAIYNALEDGSAEKEGLARYLFEVYAEFSEINDIESYIQTLIKFAAAADMSEENISKLKNELIEFGKINWDNFKSDLTSFNLFYEGRFEGAFGIAERYFTSFDDFEYKPINTSTSSKSPYDEAMDEIDEFVKYREHQISLIENQSEKIGGLSEKTYSEIINHYKSIQEKASKQADEFRKQGLKEDSKYIQELQNIWWDAEKNIEKIVSEGYDQRITTIQRAIKTSLEDLDSYLSSGNENKVIELIDSVSSKYDDIEEIYKGIYDLLIEMGYLEDSPVVQAVLDALEANEDDETKTKQDIFDKRLQHSEDYIDTSKILGWKNGDTEVKARQRILDWTNSDEYKSLLEEDEWQKEYAQRLKEYNDAVISTLDNVHDNYNDSINKINEALDNQITKEKALLDIKSKQYDAQNELKEAQHSADKEIAKSRISKQYLNEQEYQSIYNEEDYAVVSGVIDGIERDLTRLTSNFNNQIKNAYENGQEYLINNITAEYERQVELKMQELTIAQAKLDLAKKQTELNNVLNEKNIRQMIEKDGKLQWEWVADKDKIKEATDALADAQYNYTKAQDEKRQKYNLGKMQENIDDLTDEQEINNAKLKAFGDSVDNIKKIVEDMENPIGDLTKDIETFKNKGVAGLSEAVDNMISTFQALTNDNEKNPNKEKDTSVSPSITQNNHSNLGAPYGQITKTNRNWGKIGGVQTTGTVAVVQKDGTAPKGLVRGDIVTTHGGDYLITGVKSDGSYDRIKIDTSGYASGTTNAQRGIKRVNENGEETYLTKEGVFHDFSGGEVVFNSEQTKTLYDLASKSRKDYLNNSIAKLGVKYKDTPTLLNKMQNYYESNSSTYGDVDINVYSPNNFDEFTRELINAFRKK